MVDSALNRRRWSNVLSVVVGQWWVHDGLGTCQWHVQHEGNKDIVKRSRTLINVGKFTQWLTEQIMHFPPHPPDHIICYQQFPDTLPRASLTFFQGISWPVDLDLMGFAYLAGFVCLISGRMVFLFLCAQHKLLFGCSCFVCSWLFWADSLAYSTVLGGRREASWLWTSLNPVAPKSGLAHLYCINALENQFYP